MGKLIDLTGQRFGRLVVVERAANYIYRPNVQFAQWRCRCDCGAETVAQGNRLRTGHTQSCGCKQRDVVTARNLTHGEGSRRDGLSPEYQVWRGMRERCTNPKHLSYRWYGARDIKVCERWENSFENFLADMGRRPGPEYSIDRKDGGGDYTPDNCRW
ncbi:MAG: hypothetical protein GEV09_26155, partial [Pseudonocardiaceae bacterium]|nr:hypothetical protein [Pseudonocardiaceae bacterium]